MSTASFQQVRVYLKSSKTRRSTSSSRASFMSSFLQISLCFLGGFTNAFRQICRKGVPRAAAQIHTPIHKPPAAVAATALLWFSSLCSETVGKKTLTSCLCTTDRKAHFSKPSMKEQDSRAARRNPTKKFEELVCPWPANKGLTNCLIAAGFV